jgi:hypothetical protein
VGSAITLNHPAPGNSVTSFAIVAPSDFAFWMAALMSSAGERDEASPAA